MYKRQFSRFAFADVAAAQIVAGVQLIVSDLKIFMLIIVLPPRAVETCPVGDVYKRQGILSVRCKL